MKRTVRTINTKAIIGTLGAIICAAAMLVSCNDAGSDKAERIALDHAGVTAQTVNYLVSSTDTEKGKKVYEVKFYNDGYEYEYHIDAENSEILSVEKEAARIGGDGKTELSFVGEETAKEAAVKHAGLTLLDAKFERTELDKEDGKVVYEVEFRVGDYEYDYEIDAYTAEVVKSEKEYDPVKKPATPDTPVAPDTPATPDTPAVPEAPAAPELIGADRAKQIALEHAGVDADKARFDGVELDKEKGKTVYEVDFEVGSYEYEYEIDAYSGEIVKHEKEYDD